MVSDGVLKFRKQERKEVNIFNCWEAIQNSGACLVAAFAVHISWLVPTYSLSHQTVLQAFSQNFIQLLRSPVLWQHHNTSADSTCPLQPISETPINTLLELSCWVILMFPSHILDRKTICIQKVVLNFIFIASPCYICWLLWGFFFLQLILERMIEFVGTCHISF